MINTYSQRITPPFSGQVQIAESNQARALTMDGKIWEFHFLYTLPGEENDPGRKYQRRYTPVMTIGREKLDSIANDVRAGTREIDERILELITFISSASLPFPSIDRYEYWLLDPSDDSPLALIFSCPYPEQKESFPNKTEWTALPAAIMRIDRTPEEEENSEPPVNYRVERMVAERAGQKPRAQWFDRQDEDRIEFPTLLLNEQWTDEEQYDLCQRYLQRQSARLLMLHGLHVDDRKRLEIAARPHVFETERFYPCYPEIVDEKLMKTILVEARLRGVSEEKPLSIRNRRDGIHYL